MRRIFLSLILALFTATPAWAAHKYQTVEYSYGGKTFKGYLVWNEAVRGRRPGVLVVHEFWGLDDYAKSRADQLARSGAVAFAADMYGNGKAFEHPEEASAMMNEVKNNLSEW